MKGGLDLIVCPFCKSKLTVKKSGLYCPYQKKYFPIEDNIVRFTLRQSSYIVTSERDQRNLTIEMDKASSLEELKNIVAKNHNVLYPWIFSRQRGDFLYLLPDLTYSNVDTFLDAGAGYGDVIMQVAKRIRFPFTLDISYDMNKFVEKRSFLEGANVIPMLGDVLKLPFRNSLDLALLNGVFEWIGESAKAYKNPENAQIDALRSFYDALGSNGILVIAIENRFNPFYLYRREHENLFLTSFMPRVMANFISIGINKKEYRVYTHSFWKYIKLLKKTGFKHIQIFGCFPNYRFPRFTYNLENTRAIKFLSSLKHLHTNKESTYFKLLSKSLYLSRLLSPSFVIFAFKEKPTMDKRLLGDLVISGRGNFAKIINLNDGLVISALRNTKSRATIFNAIKTRPQHPFTEIPETIELDENRGYTIERIIEGESVARILKRDKFKALKLLEKIFDELLNFYISQKQAFFTLEQYANMLFEDLKKYQGSKYVKKYIDELGNIEINNQLRESKVPIVYSHGDFHLYNIFYSKSTNKVFAVDWEYARKSFALYDIFYFISLYAFTEQDYDFLRNVLVVSKPKNDFEKLSLTVLNKFLTWSNLDKNALKTAYSLFLLERLTVLLEMGFTGFSTLDAEDDFNFLLRAKQMLDEINNI